MKESKLYSILLCYPIENKFNKFTENIKIKNTKSTIYYNKNGIDIMFLNKIPKSLYVSQPFWNSFIYNNLFNHYTIMELFEFLFELNFNITIRYAYAH